MSVMPSITVDAPTRQPRPIVTCGPIVAYGPMTVPTPTRAAGSTIAVSWMTGAASAASRTSRASTSCASATTWPATLATAAVRTIRPRRRPSVTCSSSRSPGTTCRRNFAFSTPRSQARVDDGSQPATSSAATCVSDSIMSTPGMSGAPGKCPWKNSSETVTFLTATMLRPGT